MQWWVALACLALTLILVLFSGIYNLESLLRPKLLPPSAWAREDTSGRIKGYTGHVPRKSG